MMNEPALTITGAETEANTDYLILYIEDKHMDTEGIRFRVDGFALLSIITACERLAGRR